MGKRDNLLGFEKVSRRTLLKGMGSIAVTAALAGCSTDDGETNDVITAADLINMDKQEKVLFSTGAYNCGSRCVHKLHVKNNKIMRVTSAGDKPRKGVINEQTGATADDEAEYTSTELGKPMELRACVRCYGGYQGILYQPDRLKYPLVQTKSKGDVSGFKRVSWAEAYNLIADKMYKIYEESQSQGLKYYPLMTRYVNWPKFAYSKIGPCFAMMGNESFGGVDLGKYDSVGHSAYGNSKTDRLNSKFMITWALDTTRTTYWQGHTLFLNTKMKEGNQAGTMNIPMVTISSNNSDAATMLSTGVKGYRYTRIDGSEQVTDIPGWIPCRPATDGALAVALMYVIYKNERYDEAFVRNECFGFIPGDTKTSTAREKSLGGYPLVFPEDSSKVAGLTSAAHLQNDNYQGAEFTVPVGRSFEEYLLSRDVEWGGISPSSSTASYQFPQYQQPETSSVPCPQDDSSAYWKVLRYTAAITGIKAEVIEALAFKYSESYVNNNGTSFIEVGGGPQRAYNGGDWVWLTFCLAAMCGYINKPGGGLALSMNHIADAVTTTTNAEGKESYGNMRAYPVKGNGAMNIELSACPHLIMTGKDHRTKKDMIRDIKFQTGLELTESDFPLKVRIILQSGLNGIMTHGNTNKQVAAYKKADLVVICDQVMTPSAVYADIILPASTHLEKESYTVGMSEGTGAFYRAKVCDVMYDTKPESELMGGLVKKLNEKFGVETPTVAIPPFDALTEQAYSATKTSNIYKTKVGNIELPSAEELKKNGYFPIVLPLESSIVPLRDLDTKTDSLDTSTGRFNFFSPTRALRPAEKITHTPTEPLEDRYEFRPGGWRHATAAYTPMIDGYETYFQGNNPLTGDFKGYESPISNRVYKLIYMTNKSRNRAHTVFDSVAAIKDSFPQQAKMNPITAAERGIKEGDIVYVYNDRGCTKIPAHLTQSILPGIVSIEHGAWYRAHPSETVKVWIQDDATEQFYERHVPVDVGGNDNVLTNDYFGEDSLYCGGAVPAQSGPCEVSLVNPDNL